MRKWLVPLLALGAGGVGAFFLTPKGRETLQALWARFEPTPERWQEWNDSAQLELERIQNALEWVYRKKKDKLTKDVGGPAGTSETQMLLAKHGIGMSGLGTYEIRDIRGVKFAFLGFNGVGARVDRVEMKREIDLVRPQADVVVVQFHWGKEYELMPQAAAGIAPDNPRDIGHLAIDDGADLVIGNHPHWVEPVEIYKGKLITYAHGNFIFDQMWSQETREGVVGRYTFYGTQLVRVDYRPLVIDNYAQPRWLDDSTGEGKAIVDRMTTASYQLAAG